MHTTWPDPDVLNQGQDVGEGVWTGTKFFAKYVVGMTDTT